MERLVERYGQPESIRLEDGPEMNSHDFVAWAQRKGIALHSIEPTMPLTVLGRV